MEAIAWKDEDYVDKQLKIYTEKQHKVPGLEVFGYYNYKNAGSPLLLHYHESCIEIHFVVRGSLSQSINGEPYCVHGGEALFSQPKEIHDSCEMPVEVSEVYWLQLDLQNGKFLFLHEDFIQYIRKKFSEMCIHKIRIHKNIFTNLNAFYENLQAGNVYLLASKILMVILDLFACYDKQLEIKNESMQKVLELIEERIFYDVTLEELAQECDCSVTTFKQKFKEFTGIPPREYINKQKINKAKQLLFNGFTIAKTAYELGFSSSNYFATVFKRFTGYAPRDFLSFHENTK